MQLPAAFQFPRAACEVRDQIARLRKAAPRLDSDHLKVSNLDLAMKICVSPSLAWGGAIFPLVSFCRDDCVASAAYG